MQVEFGVIDGGIKVGRGGGGCNCMNVCRVEGSGWSIGEREKG